MNSRGASGTAGLSLSAPPALWLIWLAVAALAGGVPASAQTTNQSDSSRYHLIALDPGGPDAAWAQRVMNPMVDEHVSVYAPAGDDLKDYLQRIADFNARSSQPTHWVEQTYSGADFLEKMLADKPGNLVALAGNNARRTDYIFRCVGAGMNVFADAPLALTPADLPRLREAFAAAASNHVLLCEALPDRYEITASLQRELARQPALFGELLEGEDDAPAIVMEKIRYFSNSVSGPSQKLSASAFDVRQQGEGLVTEAAHLVDLAQWAAFPNQSLQPSNATVLNARCWKTPLTREQFRQLTGLDDFPASLAGAATNGALQVSANGEINFTLRGIHANVSIVWEYGPAPGGVDSRYLGLRGSKCSLVIRQGEEQKYRPTLYVRNMGKQDDPDFVVTLQTAIGNLNVMYPGVDVVHEGDSWRVIVPEKYETGREAHYTQAVANYLNCLRAGKLPEWEVPGMLTKYATIMKALEMSR